MNQLRFQIRAGSAARNSKEHSETQQPRASFRVEGGSAARAAEERNRLSGPSLNSQKGFSLRAHNGAVVRRAADQDESQGVATPHVTAVPSAPAQASVQPESPERPSLLRRIFSAFE